MISRFGALLRANVQRPLSRCGSTIRASPRAIAAAGCGAAVAAASTAVAMCEASPATPKFVLGGNRYDQTSFQGRLTHIQELIDMRTLLITDDEVAAAQALLAQYEKLGGSPDGVSDEALWDAQRKVNAVIHGPTGEKMNIFGRMSMFVPANVPIAAGLLMSKSTAATLFWQWWNQTYNVFNNYVNRAGPTVEMVPLLQSYALAVTSACGIGAFLLPRLLATFPALQALGPAVPYLAVISAGSCNVGFTRMDEIQQGIDVADADGNKLGRSIAAGKIAVFKTVTSRSMFLPIFPLLIPPVVMRGVLATGVVVAGGGAAIAIELATITLCMSVGLPAALALQPLQMELDVSSLEAEFQSLTGKDGKPITHVYASKGM